MPLIKHLLPLAAKKAYISFFAKQRNLGFYQGPFSTWQKAQAKAYGYESDIILKKALKALQQSQISQCGFERDGIWIQKREYPLALFAHLLSIQAQKKGPLSVIDFGGGLGSTYFQWKQFCETNKAIQWSVIEQPHWVKAAQGLKVSDEIQWLEHVSQAPKADVLILSGVLQYLESPFEYLDSFSSLGIRYWLFDRVPLTQKKAHQIYIQHIPKTLYEASYPSWLFAPTFKEQISQYGQIKDTFEAIDGTFETLKLHLTFKGFLVDTQ